MPPDVTLDFDSLPPVQTSFDGHLVDAMAAAIDAEDPGDLDFPSLFHGVDERVPVDALHFGVRVLYRLLLDS